LGVRLPPGALSPPRTLVATNDFPPRIGGVERFLVDLVRALPAGSVHVLAPDQPGARAVDRTIEAPVDRLPRARPGGLAPWRRRILDRLDTGGFEVVLIGQALPLGLLVSELADRGVPCVVLTHGVEYWLARLPGAAALLRRATEGARLVTAISTATATAIRSALPADLPVETTSGAAPTSTPAACASDWASTPARSSCA
jgi:phosphatidylinositol alpha-1,6-mannosyltransferase